MNNKKYELTDETKELQGKTLHRIKALKDFGNVRAGDLGGWIEREKIYLTLVIAGFIKMLLYIIMLVYITMQKY